MMTIPRTPVKILVTGGHITPAMATIEEIRRRRAPWQIVFVGRKVALEGTTTHSEEYRLITEQKLRFLPLIAGRWKREGGVKAILPRLRFPVGCVQSLWILMRERPTLIVSFGGYIALPVVLSAWLLRIPVITHEQTTRPGLANRIIARLAREVCLSFPEAAAQFPPGTKTVVTGLPVRARVLNPPHKTPFAMEKGVPLVFIVGGSTGSTSINGVVFAALGELLQSYQVIHQVGRISVAKAEEVKAALPASISSRYTPVAFVSTDAYSAALHRAVVILGRSGANTVTEIAIMQKIAIFVPLPWAGNNEQFFNAKVLERAGSAMVIEQKDFTGATLLAALGRIMRELPERRKNAAAFAVSIPSDGAKRLVDRIGLIVTPHEAS